VILANLIFGILRIKNADDTIPFRQNWNRQFINHRQIGLKVGYTIIDSPMFDMSREISKSRLIRFNDKWGFQNVSDIKNPEILFIGDSFFDDPYISYDKGLSQNFSKSMNIAAMGCSGFKVFNELKVQGYFAKLPKYIVIEVVERNIGNAWSNLFDEIESNEMKSVPYNYYGLDFLLGNNFKGVSLNSLSLDRNSIAPKKQGVMYKIDNDRSIYFYKNQIAKYDHRTTQKILTSMRKVAHYFKQNNCQVVFLVAPDKESIFPEIFSKSNLPIIQKQFDSLGISYINMHKALMESSERRNCYFDGDTHWNENAYKVLIEEIRFKLHYLDTIGKEN
jgi:hypothetical protein